VLRPLLISENYPPDRGGMAQSCDRIVRGLAEAAQGAFSPAALNRCDDLLQRGSTIVIH